MATAWKKTKKCKYAKNKEFNAAHHGDFTPDLGDFTPNVNTTVGNATLAPLNATKRWEELVSLTRSTNSGEVSAGTALLRGG